MVRHFPIGWYLSINNWNVPKWLISDSPAQSLSYQSSSYISRRYSLHPNLTPVLRQPLSPLVQPQPPTNPEKQLTFRPRRSVPNIKFSPLSFYSPSFVHQPHTVQLGRHSDHTEEGEEEADEEVEEEGEEEGKEDKEEGKKGDEEVTGRLKTKDKIETELESLCLSVTEQVLESSE